MLDAIVHHLNLDLFLVALIGHLVVESSAKFAIHGARHLGYLAALAMLPILVRVVEHQRTASESGVSSQEPMTRRRKPKAK